MVDNFLHKIDLETLKKETGLTVDEIGALVEMKNPKGVYNWSKVKANPEFVEGFREQLMEDFMKKGLVPKDQVKDIVRQEIERLLPSAKPINIF